MNFRIGQSTDVHRLIEGRKLILGGVEIPHTKGLLGHSDADALLHAIIESIIGAMGEGDIGKHFPDTSDEYKGISSLILLEKTYDFMVSNGYEIGNIDALIRIEMPKMSPYIMSMRENVARILHIDIDQINIKATRGEGLGFVGEELGVEAQAITLLIKKQ